MPLVTKPRPQSLPAPPRSTPPAGHWSRHSIPQHVPSPSHRPPPQRLPTIHPPPACGEPFVLKDGLPCDAYFDEDTARLTLSAGFVERLRSCAPKRRRSKVGYVLIAGLAVVFAVVAMNRSMRERLAGSFRSRAAEAPSMPLAPTPPSAPPVVAPEAPPPTSTALPAAPAAAPSSHTWSLAKASPTKATKRPPLTSHPPPR